MKVENGRLKVKLRSGVKTIEDFLAIYGDDDSSPSSRTSSQFLGPTPKKKAAVRSPNVVDLKKR